jgi:hypothetical protein
MATWISKGVMPAAWQVLVSLGRMGRLAAAGAGEGDVGDDAGAVGELFGPCLGDGVHGGAAVDGDGGGRANERLAVGAARRARASGQEQRHQGGHGEQGNLEVHGVNPSALLGLRRRSTAQGSVLPQ